MRKISSTIGFKIISCALILSLIFAFFQIYTIATNNVAFNVALGGKVIAECDPWGEDNGYGKGNLIDGSTDTYTWSKYGTDSEAEKTVYISFKDTYSINSVNLSAIFNNKGFPINFSISAYTESGWQEVYSKSGTTASEAPLDCDFNAVDASAVKLTVTKLGETEQTGKYALMLSEIKVLGFESDKNIALPTEFLDNVANGSEILAESITWANGYEAQKMIDGNIDTYFYGKEETSPDVNKSVYVKLANTYSVSAVTLKPYSDKQGFPVNFTVYAYTDSGWKAVYEAANTSVPESALMCKFDTVETSAVFIRVTKLGASAGDKYSVRLSELEIFGFESENNISLPEGSPDSEIYENIAPDSEIEAESPSWAAQYHSGNLNDKNINASGYEFYTSSYENSADVSKTVTFSFDKTYKVNKVILYARENSGVYSGIPEDFTLEIWNGNEWACVANKKGNKNTESKLSISFAAVDCRALRLVTQKLTLADGGPQYALQLVETEIMGAVSQQNINLPSAAVPEPELPPEDDSYSNIAPLSFVEAESPPWAVQYHSGNIIDKKINPTGYEFYTSSYVDNANEAKSILMTFDKTYKVKEVILYARENNGVYSGIPEDFTVEVWNGSKWIAVATKTSYKNSQSVLNISFNAVDCRALRVVSKKLSLADGGPQYAIQLVEMEVMGTVSDKYLSVPNQSDSENKPSDDSDNTPANGYSNVAPKGSVIAEFPHWATLLGSDRLIDSKIDYGGSEFYTSTYVSDRTMRKTISVTLDKTYSVNEIRLHSRRSEGIYCGLPEDFTVEIYNGSKWVQVASITGYKNDKNCLSVTFKSVNCSAVRVVSKKLSLADGGPDYAIQCNEFEIMGKSVSAKLNIPPVEYDYGEADIDISKNIALNCPATLSGDWSKLNGGSENLTDGLFETAVNLDPELYNDGDEVWLEANLLYNYYIDSIFICSLRDGADFPIDFTVSIFYDGKWNDVVVKKDFKVAEDGEQSFFQFKIKKTLGNKIRIKVDKMRESGIKKALSITELAAYGTLDAQNLNLPNENYVRPSSEATVSNSLEDCNYYLKYLIDGNFDTEWSTTPTYDQLAKHEIVIDLKNNVNLSEIQMKPAWAGNGFPSDFVISVYKDNDWYDVYSASDYKKPVDESIQKFSFETVKTSKFKITITKMDSEGGTYSVKLADVMAYPFATNNNFDLHAVENITSKKYEDALVVEDVDSENNKESKFEIFWIRILIGAVFIVIAISGIILLLIFLSKKNKMYL